jgi:glycosyltransferase involved in cell wall biosynthesis
LDRHDPARTAIEPLSPSFDQGSYLAFLGRLTAEKGPEDAIRIARAARAPLRIAAKIPLGETGYFKKQLEPRIDGRAVQLVGEVDEAKKQPFLAEAAAPAVSDRLAGAFRPRHDRGDGLWDASDRLPLRVSA